MIHLPPAFASPWLGYQAAATRADEVIDQKATAGETLNTALR